MPRLTHVSSRILSTVIKDRARKAAALILVLSIFILAVPPAAARASFSAATAQTAGWAHFLPNVWTRVAGLFGTNYRAVLPEEQQPRPRTYAPSRPRTKAEKESRVRSLELSVPKQLTIQSGQRLAFSAIPLDDSKAAVHGLQVSWESSDRKTIFVKRDGEAVAGSPGAAQVRARAGNKQEIIQVTVVPASSEGSDTIADARQPGAAKPASSDQRLTRFAHRTAKPAAAPLQDPPVLPSGDVASLFERRNAVGAPSNLYFPSAPTSPAAIRKGREMPGSDNYSFNLPITKAAICPHGKRQFDGTRSRMVQKVGFQRRQVDESRPVPWQHEHQ